MHLKRWLTGVISVPILIFLIGFAPRWLFYLFVYGVSLAGLIEFYRLTASHLPHHVYWFISILILLLFVALYFRQVLLVPLIMMLWAFVPMTLYMLTPRTPRQQWTTDISIALLGPVYVGLPLAMLMMIDQYPRGNGNIWIFFLLVVIFASDTGAFYCGRIFGRHKLHERISPGKTWEGAIGGLLSSLFAALLFLHIVTLHKVDLGILILVVALSIAGQIGDLAESMLKRNHGAKDSGHILPGHGGILDRIDGLLFACPILYLYLSISNSLAL
jgi:phosphatidate cytidylyltransferase